MNPDSLTSSVSTRPAPINLLPGPVMLHESVRHAFAQPSISHRSTEFSRMMGQVRRDLCAPTGAANGPLTTCVATVKATLHEIESSIAIQNEGFANLITGSQVTMDEVLRRAPSNWYIEAEEAKKLGLIEAVV